MNTRLRPSLSAGLFKAGLVCGLLFVPLVTQESQTFYGSGGTTNTATNTGNVALGYQTLFSTTTSGIGDTATGYQALYANVNGYYNTANGYQALFSNVHGAGNTATGYQALYANTYSQGNTAYGCQALYQGGGGTAVGYQALYQGGGGGVAVGYQALYNGGGGGTAVGYQALYNGGGGNNTATGYQALYNGGGDSNTATGSLALYSSTSGSHNTANGEAALRNTSTGYNNTAEGYYALAFNNTGAYNIALGFGAGQYITGSYNIAIGNNGAPGESGVIRIGTVGTQNAAYIAGINGVTVSDGAAVYIDANGQLGTLPSSRRFKKDIRDMGSVSNQVMNLRPVTFHYKDSVEKGPHSLQYGLVAEEVAKVYPNLVQYDKAGKPLSVSYHLLTPMMLNEVQKMHRRYQTQKTELSSIKTTLQQHSGELAGLKQAQEQQRNALAKLSVLVEASQGKAPLQRSANSF